MARDPQLRKFDREVGWAGGDDSDGDEDVVVERDSHLLNAHCPISLKKVWPHAPPFLDGRQGHPADKGCLLTFPAHGAWCLRPGAGAG